MGKGCKKPAAHAQQNVTQVPSPPPPDGPGLSHIYLEADAYRIMLSQRVKRNHDQLSKSQTNSNFCKFSLSFATQPLSFSSAPPPPIGDK